MNLGPVGRNRASRHRLVSWFGAASVHAGVKSCAIHSLCGHGAPPCPHPRRLRWKGLEGMLLGVGPPSCRLGDPASTPFSTRRPRPATSGRPVSYGDRSCTLGTVAAPSPPSTQASARDVLSPRVWSIASRDGAGTVTLARHGPPRPTSVGKGRGDASETPRRLAGFLLSVVQPARLRSSVLLGTVGGVRTDHSPERLAVRAATCVTSCQQAHEP